VSWRGITFLAITDPSIEQSRLFRGIDRFDPSTTAVQWRDKRSLAEGGPDWALARALAEACRSKGPMFFVNVRPELLVGADGLLAEIAPDGVHFGEGARPFATASEFSGSGVVARDGGPSPELVADARRRWGLLTRPAHDAAGVARALTEAADGVLVSPIFAVPGKGAPRGLDALREARALRGNRPTPRIFALGGITEMTRASCIEAGADGTAAIRSAWP
jgi:thiamine monophosphate synthase